MGAINWRAGFFRAWVLISIIWAIGWSVIVLPGAADKMSIARMSALQYQGSVLVKSFVTKRQGIVANDWPMIDVN